MRMEKKKAKAQKEKVLKAVISADRVKNYSKLVITPALPRAQITIPIVLERIKSITPVLAKLSTPKPHTSEPVYFKCGQTSYIRRDYLEGTAIRKISVNREEETISSGELSDSQGKEEA